MLTIAFIAVLGELEPWPLKVVFDYVLGTKKIAQCMSGVLGSTLGYDKLAILHFAVLRTNHRHNLT